MCKFAVLYVGGRKSDLEHGKCKIGFSSHFYQRNLTYQTANPPDDNFKYQVIYRITYKNPDVINNINAGYIKAEDAEKYFHRIVGDKRIEVDNNDRAKFATEWFNFGDNATMLIKLDNAFNEFNESDANFNLSIISFEDANIICDSNNKNADYEMYSRNYCLTYNNVSDSDSSSSVDSVDSADEDADDVDSVDADDNDEIMNKYRYEKQNDYINDCVNELLVNNRCVCKAPTGFGKSVISNSIINKLSIEDKNFRNILQLTPRINLNHQLTDNKYTKYFNCSVRYFQYSVSGIISVEHKFKELLEFIDSNKTNTINIVICCYQSCKNLFPLLAKNNIVFDFCICDEAHFMKSWANYNTHPNIETAPKTDAENHKKLLLDENMIIAKKILFATATPVSEMLEPEYSKIFGKCIEHVQIYELISKGILCDFETLIKKIDTENDDKSFMDIAETVNTTMIKYKKRKGIIYVNTQNNAKSLYAHWKRTLKFIGVKIYIYISDKLNQEYFNERGYYDIKFESLDTSLKDFEEYEGPAVIIACDKISYGYDNYNIDLICFGDCRQSDIDVRQIIGRGMRTNPEYPNKILHIILPIFITSLSANDDSQIDNQNNCVDKYKEYNKIKSFLRFIVNECGKDLIDGFIISNYKHDKSKSLDVCKSYDGDSIPVDVCNELSFTLYNNYSRFMNYLRFQEVHNCETYNRCAEKNIWMVKLGDIRSKFKKFNFRDLDYNNRDNYYETKEECEIAKTIELKKIISRFGGIDRLRRQKTQSQINQLILENDKKIPENYELYYI